MIPNHVIKKSQQRMEPYQTEGFVLGKGSSTPKIMLIGEAPGRNEVERGEPFIGRAGDKLDDFLTLAGLSREEIYITSVVRSRPYHIREKTNQDGTITRKTPNRAPNKKEMLAHAPLLDYQIQHLQPDIIVTLGNVALKRLLGDSYKITEVHGELLYQPIYYLQDDKDTTYTKTEQSYSIYPTFHPASVFYRQVLQETIEKDFTNLRHLLS